MEPHYKKHTENFATSNFKRCYLEIEINLVIAHGSLEFSETQFGKC